MSLSSEGMPFADRCRKHLDDAWKRIVCLAEQGSLPAFVQDEQLQGAIRRAMRSSTKTYRYVLPTQLVAKLADPSLDCRCVQVARGGKGAFDARSVCQHVVVPFERANHSVLGGSSEPYVNNPLRVPEVSERFLSQQKNKKGWRDLCAVLALAETRSEPRFTKKLLLQVLAEVHELLEEVAVTYPVPKRISLDGCMSLIEEFVAQPSGGDRPLALAAALFRAIGNRFRLFHKVLRKAVTAPDAPSGRVADLECTDQEGSVVIAVEVKDQELTLKHISDKLDPMRHRAVSEFFFLVRNGVKASDQASVADLLRDQFAAGHNLYVFDLITFSRSAAALLGEPGRRDFLHMVGEELDAYGSALTHRKAWAELLSSS